MLCRSCSTCALAVALAIGCGDKSRDAPVAAPPLTTTTTKPVAAPATVRIAGSVIDRANGKAVGNVAVVLLGSAGEMKTVADASGAFAIDVPPGGYRAFVRDDRVMSVGLSDRVRLPRPPRRELVEVPDEALTPLLEARTDLTGIEITVVESTEVIADVYADHDVNDAIVRLRAFDLFSTPRPVLGTDIGVTGEDGYVHLHVPAGNYFVEIAHADHAGSEYGGEVRVSAGKREEVTVPLVRGCIISGRVVNSDGSPAADGAIERMNNPGGFRPAGGSVDAGRFRWSTTETGQITLRAWPWRSPPSNPKTFTCRDGKRFTDVVLRLPDQRPDLSGTIVDASGAPVPLTYLDVQPLDAIPEIGQQERADAAGNWHVYDMPPARYRIRASAAGRGMVDTVVVAPRHDLKLTLGGTGRIVGTTTDLVNGSVEVSFMFCGSKDDPQAVPHDHRIVPVIGGRFTVERAPACTLTFAVRWRDKLVETSAVVQPDLTSYVEVDVGAPREKTVTGVVRDREGNAVDGARVTAVVQDREIETVRTDAQGRFTVKTHSGAQLVGNKDEQSGRARVGRANVAAEQIDLVLDGSSF